MDARSGILTALDRCDSCGAAAWVRTTFRTGPLDWCGHHYGELSDAMKALVIDVIDERALILGGA